MERKIIMTILLSLTVFEFMLEIVLFSCCDVWLDHFFWIYYSVKLVLRHEAEL